MCYNNKKNSEIRRNQENHVFFWVFFQALLLKALELASLLFSAFTTPR